MVTVAFVSCILARPLKPLAMKVLIAEDSLLMRQLLRSSLIHWQYEVVEAEDGVEAWEWMQRESFSLVLTDWLMPEMDGLELIRRIRAREWPGYVYVILLTAKTEKEDLIEAMEAGADDFLRKPFDRGELRVRMREGERIIRLEQKLSQQNRQLRETQAALVQSEKLAGLGQLAAGMAHEVNNPVSYVTNNLTVLHREMRALMQVLQAYQRGSAVLDEQAPQLAREIEQLAQDVDLPWIQQNLEQLFGSSLDGLRRVRDIVTNLRSFARLDEAELDELDLNSAVQSTVEVLRHDIDAQQLNVELTAGEVPPVSCHPGKIHQLFHILLLNAIQASEPQGTVQVRTFGNRDQAVVEFQDHGCGIDPADQPRIFEPFFTTRAVGRGTGLGLAIAYGIVRDHGGSIEFESQLDVGSMFRVRLPVRPAGNREGSAVRSTD